MARYSVVQPGHATNSNQQALQITLYCERKKDMRVNSRENPIPIWEKETITLAEAILYTGIGRDKLKAISDTEDCDFVIWVGNRRLFKRKKLEEYLEKQYSL